MQKQYEALRQLSRYTDVLLDVYFEKKELPITANIDFYLISQQADSLKDLLKKLYFKGTKNERK